VLRQRTWVKLQSEIRIARLQFNDMSLKRPRSSVESGQQPETSAASREAVSSLVASWLGGSSIDTIAHAADASSLDPDDVARPSRYGMRRLL